MADVKSAVDFVIGLEDDAQHPGSITQLRGDSGGRTRLGIAQRWHPELTPKGFFDGVPIVGSTNPLRWTPTLDVEEGLAMAEEVYEKGYAEPLSLDQFASQDVANRLLGFAVNEGQHQAVVCLQRCLPGLVVDGSIGPKTIAAANALDPAILIGRMKAEQTSFYATLAATNPNLAEYANGLKNRASA